MVSRNTLSRKDESCSQDCKKSKRNCINNFSNGNSIMDEKRIASSHNNNNGALDIILVLSVVLGVLLFTACVFFAYKYKRIILRRDKPYAQLAEFSLTPQQVSN